MNPSVIATPKALEVIATLQRQHGDILFHQADGCLEGAGAHCYRQGEIPISQAERVFGEILDVPFIVGPRTYESWQGTQIVIDVASGASDDSFSLESGLGVRFVNRWQAC